MMSLCPFLCFLPPLLSSSSSFRDLNVVDININKLKKRKIQIQIEKKKKKFKSQKRKKKIVTPKKL